MASRKDIDKETMFNKIMPSNLKSPRQLENSSEATLSSSEASPPLGSFAPPSMDVPPPPAVSEAPRPAPKQKTGLFSTDTGVQFIEKKPIVLVNTMEKLVAGKLDAAFAKFNCCKCDRCKMDVAAVALNKLTPKYEVMEQDALPGILSAQISAEVSTAVVQAILIVRNHPRH